MSTKYHIPPAKMPPVTCKYNTQHVGQPQTRSVSLSPQPWRVGRQGGHDDVEPAILSLRPCRATVQVQRCKASRETFHKCPPTKACPGHDGPSRSLSFFSFRLCAMVRRNCVSGLTSQ